MKKLMSILSMVLMSAMLVSPLTAFAQPDRMVDQADLLSDDEETRVRQELDVISNEMMFDIVVVTVDSTEGQDIQDFADDYYDYNGYGFGEDYDGAILVINMEEREWYISTCGYGIVAMPSEDIDYIAEEFLLFLSAGEYQEAFLAFAESCQVYVNDAREMGLEYDEEYYEEYYDEYYDEEVVAPVEEKDSVIEIIGKLIACLGVGFVLAFIPMMIMKGKMKTVELKAEAHDYLVPNSRKLTVSRDRFMYHTVNRVAKPKDNPNRSSGGGGGVHISSSGRSHGGGGGKF